MTALEEFERLESPGLWRPGAGEQRRDVYVTIGDAELVIEDRNGAPLSHWSLPALRRINPRELPARYAPDTDSAEQLEIEEPEMVAALDRVVSAVAKGRRRPGALRRVAVGACLVAALGLGLLWLPGALRTQAATILPAAQRAGIGAALLREITALSGPPCAGPAGAEALDELRDRLFPLAAVRLVVLRDLPHDAMALPGGLIVLSERLLTGQDDPDVAAGNLVATFAQAQVDPPLARFLGDIGTLALARMLVSGDVPAREIATQAERLILRTPPEPTPAVLRPAFDAAQVDWPRYARATGLPEGEPAPSQMPPAMQDGPWQALREICS